jgi:SAM-dependent methyltransferase
VELRHPSRVDCREPGRRRLRPGSVLVSAVEAENPIPEGAQFPRTGDRIAPALYDRAMVGEDVKRATFETWEAMAPGWERWRAEIEATSTPVREWLIRELAPRPGDTVLELAAGPGDTGFEVAVLVGDGGRVISTDLTPAMVEVARRRSSELGLRNVEHRVLDAERIDLPDDSVDGVVCRFGFMLMPDVAAACSETRRVLRDGGRLASAVWRGAEVNPWISIVGRMLVERSHAPRPEPGAPGIFALANEDRLRSLLESAGFTVERLEDVTVRFVYRDVDDYVRRARDTGGLFATVWRTVSAEEHDAMKARLGGDFAPYGVDGGYELPGVALAAVAS